MVDDQEYGNYKTVYADLDRDGEFGDEVPMRPGEETSGLDTNGDGLWDVSGGLVYWVSDRFTRGPYMEIRMPPGTATQIEWQDPEI